jgi:hypothetical protein
VTDLARRHISRAAFWLGEEIRRRQQFGIPIPSSLRATRDALNRELSAAGNQPTALPAWKTKELAAEQGCTPRTARNRAASAGGKLVGGRWFIPEGT